MILLSGNSNKLLANHISNHAGIALSEMKLTRFADGEIFCEIHQNIRGEDVFIIPVSYTHLTLPTKRIV